MTIGELVRGAHAEAVGLSADECLKCNVCNTVCPVARVTDLFPGPKYVGPQAQRFRLDSLRSPGTADDADHGDAGTPQRSNRSPDLSVDFCSGCGFCTPACPADVKIAEINSRARAVMREGHRPRLRDWLISQTDLLGKMGVPLAPIANLLLQNRLGRLFAHAVLGIHRAAPLPRFASRSFRSRWRERQREREGGQRGENGGTFVRPPPSQAVVLFHGCAANYQEPWVAEAAIAVLERNGYEVIVPEQVCCGLPMISNGLYDRARAKARQNFGTLAELARQGYAIVGTSTSCTHTLKAEYREMLDLDDADARAVADATWDICEFLLDLHEDGRLDTRFGRLDQDLPYHPPCQLRSHGIGIPALDLFALIPGLRAADMDHDCCGVAGTYGLKREKYDIAMAVGKPLFERIRSSGASEAACDSETCRWQIAQATGVPVRHPVEYLAAAYATGNAETSAGS
jgi:glycerol-3-phosphate dehydrogenase subunit C